MAFKGYSDKYKLPKGEVSKSGKQAIDMVIEKGKTIVDRFDKATTKNSRRGVF